MADSFGVSYAYAIVSKSDSSCVRTAGSTEVSIVLEKLVKGLLVYRVMALVDSAIL